MSREIAIDLGTANSLVYVQGKGIVLREPSVVAIEKGSNKVLAVGDEAKKMIGRTPGNIVAVKPLKDGFIADFDVASSMLKYFFSKALNNTGFFSKPRVIICVPAGITSVEERAVRQAAMQAGAKEVYIMEEPMAAAIGAGLPVEEPTGSMIVDIGGGTTDVAIISLGGIVTSQSIRIGGDKMDDAIVSFVKKKYNLLIGERTAEEIKIAIGTVHLMNGDPLTYMVNGRDLMTGLPRQVEISDDEIHLAFKEIIQSILESIKSCLEKTPPELAGDIIQRGIVLAGGGALIRGMDVLIAEETGMPVFIAEDPLSSIVLGAGKALDNINLLKQVASSGKKLN